jgi:RimJ/RimL family protein N-acetyltransferase
MSAPTLRTERLLLRLPVMADAAAIKRLAGDHRVADTAANIPHPYERAQAENWVRRARRDAVHGKLWLAVTLAGERTLIGVVGLVEEPEGIGNLSYWIGVPHWRHGYATEAAAAMLAHGFEAFGLEEIRAIRMSRNVASGRVLEKMGMEHVGSSIDLVRGELVPIERYRIDRDAWSSRRRLEP